MAAKTPESFRVDPLNEQEVQAIRAIRQGDASEYLQKLAFATILKKLSRAYDQHFVPGQADQTTFLSGRAFVGQQLLKYSNTSPYPLTEQPND